MSKWFAASDSDSSSSSSDSEDERGGPTTTIQQSNFYMSDDEEETKRIVRSAREKRYEALNNLIHSIRNSKKIKDFNKMETHFVDLCKAYEKAKPVIEKEEKGVTPRFYVRILVELDDLINETWEDKDGRKRMSKNNSKSLGAMRQKLRKYIKDFDEDMAKFRENPDANDDEEAAEKVESDAEDESKDEDSSAPVTKSDFKKKSKSTTPADGDDEDDSDDSYWDSDSDEESSSSSEEDTKYASLRERFLKKTSDKDDDKKEKKAKDKAAKKKEKKLLEEDEDDDEEDGWIKVDGGGADKPKMFEKDAEINHELVLKKLREIMAARGRKRTNRKEQIELLNELYHISEDHNLGIGMAVKIKFADISAIFDYNPKISAAMKPEYWEKCVPAVDQLLDMVGNNTEDLITGEHILEDSESFEEKPYKVRGCFLAVCERLNEEFYKVLKSCDAHSHEYVERLKDEEKVMAVLQKAQKILEKSQTPSEMCRIYLQQIDHIYFKFDSQVIKQKNGEIPADIETSLHKMREMSQYIYAKDTTDRLRTRAILSHVYHHAIHDNWYEARDLMLMSHLQDTISHSDPLTQILYNRTMVQLGLCGFRHAEIRDAHNALLDIQLGGRSKELLAQGLLPQRHHERSSEQEKIEKQRQMPFHMHINLELLECVYLVSAMLIEIPYMAAHEFDARRRMISKSYYQQLRSSERQALVGPPESMREHVVAASKAMRNGDWEKCRDFIINPKMNAKVWDLFYEADKVRAMLARKIQEETLRTYLFTYSKVYNSISIVTLAETFKLEKQSVHAIVAKMIISEELMASMDEPTECMVMHRTEPSRLQALSLQLSDKLAQLVENNERLLELRPGGWQGQWRNKDGNDRRDGKKFDGKFSENRGDRNNERRGDRNNDRNDRNNKFGDRNNDRNHDRGDRNNRGGFSGNKFGNNSDRNSGRKFQDKNSDNKFRNTFSFQNRE